MIGYIKGKRAIHLARVYGERRRNYVGQHFWARGYFVSTVGRDEAVIREYIKNQEKEDQRLEQLNLWLERPKLLKPLALPGDIYFLCTTGRFPLGFVDRQGSAGAAAAESRTRFRHGFAQISRFS